MVSSHNFWIGVAVGFVGCHFLKGHHHGRMHHGHH